MYHVWPLLPKFKVPDDDERKGNHEVMIELSQMLLPSSGFLSLVYRKIVSLLPSTMNCRSCSAISKSYVVTTRLLFNEISVLKVTWWENIT